MQRLGTLLPRTLLAASALGLVLACAGPPVTEQPPKEDSNNSKVLLLVLEFDHLGTASETTATLAGYYERWGRALDPDEASRTVADRFAEIRDGHLVVVEYQLEYGDDQVDQGYFVVDRTTRSEVLVPGVGGHPELRTGLVESTVMSVPLPYRKQAHTVRLGRLDIRDEIQWERSERQEFPPLTLNDESFNQSEYAAAIAESVVGTEVLTDDTGPDRLNIVFLGDGFTEGDSLLYYQQEVGLIRDRMLSTYPFPTLEGAVNIYRVDVVSDEAGVDLAEGCPVSRPPIDRENALGTHLCGSPSPFVSPWYNYIGVEDQARLVAFAQTAFENSPTPGFPHQIMVLVNEKDAAGSAHSGADQSFVSVHTIDGGAPPEELGYGPVFETDDYRDRFRASFFHELGHSRFDLGDEYCDRGGGGFGSSCVATEVVYPGGEPYNPNLTLATPPAAIKWEHLIAEGEVDIPTWLIGDCYDPPLSTGSPDRFPLSADLVGLYEGAGGNWYSCGVFRPSLDCAMDDPLLPFCPVCRSAIVQGLSAYLDEGVSLLLDTLTCDPAMIPATDPVKIQYKISLGTASTSGEISLSAPAVAGDVLTVGTVLGSVVPTVIPWPSEIELTLSPLNADGTALAETSVTLPAHFGTHIAVQDGCRMTFSVAGGLP